ncbi:MAG: ATP-binding protein [Bacteroidales bacterium]|nr:ATP-binding protein [Bacteroidales bacterium]
MFYRTIINELRKWAAKPDRRPLVLRGARQVGKTTAVKMFAGEFDLFIYLNLEKAEERNIFEGEYPFNELLNRLFLYVGEEKNAGRTLIFIDEIQNSPKTMALLRFFYEEADDLYVIAAGSLLENIMDENISFPVGRVEFMVMNPCTFKEFLGAMGEEQSLKLYGQEDTPSYAHDKLSALFKKYATIGGMPQVLESYSSKQDYTALNSIYSSLITSYSEDVEKYARSASMTQYIRHIISTAFREAGSRITFEKFGNSPYRSREMKEAFTTLEKTMLLKLVYPVTSTKLPFSPDLKKKPRLHIFDTGLVNYSLGILGELIAEKYLDNVYRGRIAEHIVGQELAGNSFSVMNTIEFWTREKKESSAEVDYVVSHKGMLIPVEVKGGASGSLRSLHQFVDAAPHAWAVRFYSGKMAVENSRTIAGKNYKLINLPFYLAGKLDRILNDNIGLVE